MNIQYLKKNNFGTRCIFIVLSFNGFKIYCMDIIGLKLE